MEQAIDGLRGFDYEVATEVFTLLGYKIEVKFLPCKRVLQYAKLGKTLGVLTCAYRKDRENFLIFPIQSANLSAATMCELILMVRWLFY